MYILVRLLKGFPQPLFYKIPQKLLNNKQNFLGKIAQVPLKDKKLPALILKIYAKKPAHITIRSSFATLRQKGKENCQEKCL